MKNFYFSDVDDTIISEVEMSEKLKKMFDIIKNKGDIFIPCSGRPTDSMIKQFSPFVTNYVAGFNGAEIYDLQAGKYIFQSHIEKEDIERITSSLNELGANFLVYENGVYSDNPENKYGLIEKKTLKIDIKKYTSVNRTPKVLGLVDVKSMKEVKKKMTERFPDFNIIESKPYFLEIIKKGISKGAAIEYVMQREKLDKKQVYCFGDSGNDIAMFDLDVEKLAVGNAIEEIKKRATKIIDSCENDGVPKYIFEKYGE